MKLSDTAVKIGGAVIAVAIGLADLWHFHSLGTTADMGFIIGGLAVAGVGTAAPAAFAMGVRQGATQAPKPVSAPPGQSVRR